MPTRIIHNEATPPINKDRVWLFTLTGSLASLSGEFPQLYDSNTCKENTKELIDNNIDILYMYSTYIYTGTCISKVRIEVKFLTITNYTSIHISYIYFTMT